MNESELTNIKYFKKQSIVFAICFTLLTLLLSIKFNAFYISHNDDWSFRSVADQFLSKWHFEYNSWIGMTFFGQLLIPAGLKLIFGLHQWIYGASTLFFSFFTVLSSIYISSKFLTYKVSLLIAISMISLPGFMWSSVSFMTDNTAMSLFLIAISFAMASIDSSGIMKKHYLSLSIIFSMWAFSIRDYYVFLPIVILFVSLKTWKKNRLFLLTLAAISALGDLLIYNYSRSSTPYTPNLIGNFQIVYLHEAFSLIFTLALFISPATLLILYRSSKKFLNGMNLYVFLSGFSFGVWFLLYSATGNFFIGDYMTTTGIDSTIVTPGGRPTLVLNLFFNFFIIISIVSFSVLLVLLTKGFKRISIRLINNPGKIDLLWLSLIVYFGEVLFLCSTSVASFDRMIWPIVPIAFTILLHENNLKIILNIGSVLLTTTLFAFGLIYSLNGFAFDQARWNAGTNLIAKGFLPQHIDAGFEWVGSHQPKVSNSLIIPGTIDWYTASLFPGQTFDAFVAGSELNVNGTAFIGTISYNEFGFFGTRHVYMYKVLLPHK